jgi:hypothetical protein
MLGEIPPACDDLRCAKSDAQVLIVSGWSFAATPHYGRSRVLVSEVVMGQWRMHKPKPRKSPDADNFKKRKKPRPFNKPKPD